MNKVDKETIKITVEGEGTTLVNMLRHKLMENKDIDFAGYKQDHPLIDKIILTVKAKPKKDPRKVVISALNSLGKEWKELEIK